MYIGKEIILYSSAGYGKKNAFYVLPILVSLSKIKELSQWKIMMKQCPAYHPRANN